MKLRYSLIIIFLIFIFAGCASDTTRIKRVPDELIPVKIKELKENLIANGVPGEWFDEQLQRDTFHLHSNIYQYFQKSAEKQTDHDKEYDLSWYFTRLNVDARIEKGKTFIESNRSIFDRVEARHGIRKELIAAIIGIETNFADHRQRGSFYAFNSLVSQYIFADRKNFAVREITALYKFSKMTGHPPQYFTSSYAGAIGWGQFIPSSLLTYFIDANGANRDIDPFDLEDTIFSVENYLYKNRLSGENIDDYDSRYAAVFAYNHSDAYVKAVLYIYDHLLDYFHQDEATNPN